MLHNFGLYKRPLLTVLAVLLTTAFTTASAAMIDLSQLTPNTTQPVALSTIQSSTSNEAPTLAPYEQYGLSYRLHHNSIKGH